MLERSHGLWADDPYGKVHYNKMGVIESLLIKSICKQAHIAMGNNRLIAMCICGHSDERIVEVECDLQRAFLLNAALSLLKDNKEIQVLSKEQNIYGMHMQIGHKLVCQIQGPQKESEKIMMDIAARWKRFLLNPLVDM